MNNSEEIIMNEAAVSAAAATVSDVDTGSSLNMNESTMTPGPTPIELKEEIATSREEGKNENFAQEMTEAMYNVHSTVNAALMDVDSTKESEKSSTVDIAVDTTKDATVDTTNSTVDTAKDITVDDTIADTTMDTKKDTAANIDTANKDNSANTGTDTLSPQVIKEQLKYCQRILKGLKRHREAGPFLLPVDPVALNIPDYLTVIKQPMDLSTISKKIEFNEYADAEAFMGDVRLMLNNCFTYNAPDSQVTKMGRNIEKYFNTSMAKMNNEIAGNTGTSISAVESQSASRPKRESVSAGAGAGAGNVIRRASSPSGSLTFCSSVLRELMKKTNSHLNWPFLMPVDPVSLNIPDYFEVVKQPMDLGTIRKKLDTGMYARSDQFEADVRLVFGNCYTYNPAESDVCRMAHELEAIFDLKMSQKPAPKSHSNTSAASSAASSSASLPSNNHNHSHHNSHFIPSSASQLIPGLDSLEDESEKILAINHQIQILQSELNYLLLNRKSSSSSASGVSIGTLNKQNSAGNKAAATKKKNSNPAAPSALSSSGVANNNKTSSSTATAPTFGPNEDMTFDEKRQLSEDVSNLPQENMMRVLEIIQECMPNLHSNGDSDVIELDIEALDLRTLRALQSYIWTCLNPNGKKRKANSGNTKSSAAAASSSQKKTKQEESIQNQSQSQNVNGSYDSSSSSSSEEDD